MLIERRNPRGIVSEREIPVTYEQLGNWRMGMLIQVAMPNVSLEDREFLISGWTPEQWNELFNDENQ